MTTQPLKQPDKQSEIIVDATQLAVAEQVGDQTQQAEDFQPKILAILGKIESNTSALLRGAAGANIRPLSLSKSNVGLVSNKHQSNTNQVLDFVQNHLAKKGGTGSVVDSSTYQVVANPRKNSASTSRPKSEGSAGSLASGYNLEATPSSITRNAKDVQLSNTSTYQAAVSGSPIEAVGADRTKGESNRVSEHNVQSVDERDRVETTPLSVTRKAKKDDASTSKAIASGAPVEAVGADKTKGESNHKSESVGRSESDSRHYEGSVRQEKSSKPRAQAKSQQNAEVSASEQAQQEQKEKRDRKGIFQLVGDAFRAVKDAKEKESLEAGDAATDAAGSAVGGTLWEAAKEVKEAADDAKESSLGQKLIEKFTGKKTDPVDSVDEEAPKADKTSQKGKQPQRDENGRFVRKGSQTKTSERKSNTQSILKEHQLNTQNSSNHLESKEVRSASVVKEREQIRSNEAISDRLDEQSQLSQKQHKELIAAIEKKASGGEGGSLMDSVSEITDLFGGGDGAGGKKSKGKPKKGRLGSFVDRIKGNKTPTSVGASSVKAAPTTKLGKVAQSVKSATGSLANSGVGKAAGGALKTVGSVASRAAAPVAALATGYFKYNEVKDREDLTGSQKAVQVGATTAGSLGGASAGAAMGAAMGSVVPVVGTLIGWLLGAAVGGWLGSKGGDIVGEAISDNMEGTDGKTRSERESIAENEAMSEIKANSEKAETSDVARESIETHATVEALATPSVSTSETKASYEVPVAAEQLKTPLPDITPSKTAIERAKGTDTRTERIETVARFDEKKLSKAIVDGLKASQQGGVSAPAAGGRYSSGGQSQAQSIPTPIRTEFDDKSLLLMAHDRI
ncbi:TPA: hypothetical protein ACMDRZ_003064 [Vibrio cholerae]|uniref:hypothetical protein n=1 Tax=Vibrio cholerae TaxID=666 RepID=UPI0015829B40|nr:hypothetical protein [Vibrio cholerae]QKU65663.1 hypothetical protein HPY17_20310 [Vibrio cholerae]QKU69467.1 hypothetical protein HPY10_19960 [Vibrio cholerae]